MTVVSAARERKRKNVAPHVPPPAICANTFGKATKMRPGPALTSTPNAAHAGKTMRPARKATVVSIAMIHVASVTRERERST